MSDSNNNDTNKTDCPKHGRYTDPDETALRSGKGQGIFSKLFLETNACSCGKTTTEDTIFTKRISTIFRKYTLVAAGWIGVLTAITWMLSLISGTIAILLLLFTSGIAVIHGHHGLSMGWFNQSSNTTSEDKSSNTQVKRKFKVNGFHEGIVWLRLVEGDKSGLDFGIPAEQLRSEASKGDIVTVTLESLNEKNTKWELETLHNITEYDPSN